MKKNIEFIKRFIEACGSSEASDIQRLLNIPYQSAKNYLEGRFPNSDKLILISEVTGSSIDWLLTGRGKKFLDGRGSEDTPIPARQIEKIARRVCVEVINEMNGSPKAAQPKVVVLQSSELMSEKASDNVPAFTGRQP
jgi:phage repressor protein C with HTH and peptisase S24 domain